MSEPSNPPQETNSLAPIAIVGMGGVFPGASNLSEFWENIKQAKSSAQTVPEHRWVMPHKAAYSEEYQPDKTYSKIACLVDDSFAVDLEGLSLPASLLGTLDPLYLMTLHAGSAAYRSANMSSIDPARAGVCLAAIALPTDGSSALTRATIGEAFAQSISPELSFVWPTESSPPSAEESLNGRVTSMPASLLAQSLQLGGRAFTLDAACASSLYAIKLACDELREGRADAMLAGGVSRPENLYTQVGFSQLKALSPSGQCAPFDKKADGLVVGEGAGIFLLKRLDDAVRDRDNILGVIRGVGLSNDIGGSLLAPETEGQLRAMHLAYTQAGWKPNTVDLIECHGTGTPLGDKTEFQSLCELWKQSCTWKPQQCVIGSIKSMIGHLLTGASAASLVKVLLAFQHQTLPPTANVSEPAFAMEESPFQVLHEPSHWPTQEGLQTRRAAVSGFGFGGINAHLLVEEWDNTQEASTTVDVGQSFPEREPVAIVGMDVHVGQTETMQAWATAVLQGQPLFTQRPKHRWSGADQWFEQNVDTPPNRGAYLSDLSLPIGTFRLPPNEINQLLPQQLLMLQVAAKAMRDARLPLRENRPRMGAFIGVGFDFECTRFHLRWALWRLASEWAEQRKLNLNDEQLEGWIAELQESLGPALNATRTVGALGGIVASRVAKEFLLGGSSYILSAEETSGIQALELAARALQRGELDAALVGAVDIAGDITHIASMRALKPSSTVRIGEGACAVVLKRLSDAMRDGDRIYATLKGFGIATGGDLLQPDSLTLRRATRQAHQEAKVTPQQLSYLEIADDRTERSAWQSIREDEQLPLCISRLSHVTGHLGACASLASVLKASLALHHKILPATPNAEGLHSSLPNAEGFHSEDFHVPQAPQPWLRNRIDGPRCAAVQSLALGGLAASCILEEAPQHSEHSGPPSIATETHALFVMEGDSPTDLLILAEALQKRLQQSTCSLRDEAALWLKENPLQPKRCYAISLVTPDRSHAQSQLQRLLPTLSSGEIPLHQGEGGLYSTPSPLAPKGKIAFVYPGSGNHYLEMGRELGLRFPQALAQMDAETERLMDQMLPHLYMPWRSDWSPGWRSDAAERIAAHPHHMIFGQVVHGGLVTEVCRLFGLKEDAVIGYSLGESAALFASKAWPERGQMLQRMEASELFTTQLAGPCEMARQVWGVPNGEEVCWRTAVVPASSDQVKRYLSPQSTARLLIVNTPDECVVGGRQNDVEELIQKLRCEAIYLEGVVTVHCEVVEPVKEDYRSLHLFPTEDSQDIAYYSGHLGGSYPLSSNNAAESVLHQALYGFDYTKTIQQAYKDGVRLFVEMGPGSSCTRMIHKILHNQNHFAQSACVRGERDVLSLQKLMAGLLSQRVPLHLEPLSLSSEPTQERSSKPGVIVPVGQPFQPPKTPDSWMQKPSPPAPTKETPEARTIARNESLSSPVFLPPTPAPQPIAEITSFSQSAFPTQETKWKTSFSNIAPVASLSTTLEPEPMTNKTKPPQYTLTATHLAAEILPGMTANLESRGQAHDTYLRMSQQNQQAIQQTIALQQHLLTSVLPHTESATSPTHGVHFETPRQALFEMPAAQAQFEEQPTQALYQQEELSPAKPAFTKEQCMEFAIGSIAKVLGPEFAVIDSYDVRVRLPDEPLMLVDRILTISGEKRSLGAGNLVTEHDVEHGAWYLDAERMPVCVTVEAGQADLFLCSYLGIDFELKGKRSYRLLDAEIHFHRELPKPGETIQYDITIDKFVRQGDVFLFFFRFDGSIDGAPLLTMRNGCAGFFTDEEIHESRGIVRTTEEWQARAGKVDPSWQPLLPFEQAESYNEEQVEALRRGEYAACFGPMFQGLPLQKPTFLPSGRMKLFDRVLEANPNGGRYGLGLVRAEADIHPDDWFLTCHFMDDMVMPGTLMYECCAHTLRVLLMRMGWVGEHSTTHFEPVPGIHAKLACRGPVTPSSQKVVYEVEIKEIGVHPYPFVVADALMYVDGKCSVSFDNMSIQMTGQSFSALQQLWSNQTTHTGYNRITGESNVSPLSGKPVLYDTEQILAYAVGNPSQGFGEPYTIFDNDRVIARLPGPPYLFLDRVVEVEPEPWELKVGGWIETEYEIPADAWYFAANHQPVVPFAVLLEVALQPCGWLAAYLGSALQSQKDLSFRNLGGEGTLTRMTLPTSQALTVRVRMFDVAKAGGMLIERFDLKVLQQGELIYDGKTYFGFFTQAALSSQVGILDAKDRLYEPTEQEISQATSHNLEHKAPLLPKDEPVQGPFSATMPGKSLLMLDRIDIFLPQGGPKQLGFLRGSKDVDPNEWFFDAHFYQDPVCPGSLGLESFLQLLRFYMLERWGESHGKDHIFEPILLHEKHRWEYRGQILPSAKTVEVDAVITEVRDGERPVVKASGFLKVDGLFIYEMIDFGLRMIPAEEVC